MAGFTSFDDLISEITVNGKLLQADFAKRTSVNSQAAGIWHSLWRFGDYPAAGADPATTPGTAYDNADGSLAKWADQDPSQKHLLTLGFTSTVQSEIMLYDRLVGVSGISVASTGNKTINSVALPRYTNGEGVECWLEVTTATTTTAPVVSLNSYTNQGGTGGRSGGTIAFPAAATVANALIGPMPLQAGDSGIRSIEVGLNVGTAAAAGVINVLLLKPIAILSCPANVFNERDFVTQLPSLPRIYDGGTLALAILHNAAAASQIFGMLRAAYG